MPKIVLNGEPREVAKGASVGDLLAAEGYAQRKIAVEVNREIVPKSQHAQHPLREGDRVEIVHAMGGG
jgi:sulfur carrier protein